MESAESACWGKVPKFKRSYFVTICCTALSVLQTLCLRVVFLGYLYNFVLGKAEVIVWSDKHILYFIIYLDMYCKNTFMRKWSFEISFLWSKIRSFPILCTEFVKKWGNYSWGDTNKGNTVDTVKTLSWENCLLRYLSFPNVFFVGRIMYEYRASKHCLMILTQYWYHNLLLGLDNEG